MDKAKFKPTAGQIVGFALAGLAGAALAVLANVITRAGADAGDWLQFFGGALGAAFAVFGAAFLEKRSKERERIQDRHDAIREVLRAVDDALAIYAKACEVFPGEAYKSNAAQSLSVRADHIKWTLERLLTRPSLTDGAIACGAGAMRLMENVARSTAIFWEDNGTDFPQRATRNLKVAEEMHAEVKARRARVASNADANRPSWLGDV